MTIVWRTAIAVAGGALAAGALNAITSSPVREGGGGLIRQIPGNTDNSNPAIRAVDSVIHPQAAPITYKWWEQENRLSSAVLVSRSQRSGRSFRDSLDSIDRLLESFKPEPKAARLIGWAFGYGLSADSELAAQLPHLRALDDPGSFVRFVLPGVLAAESRKPDAKKLFDTTIARIGGSLPDSPDMRSDLYESCIRLAAESGYMEPDAAIDLLISQPGSLDEQRRPAKDRAVKFLETSAILSPLTFGALTQKLEKRFPGYLSELLASAKIPAGTMADLIKELPKNAKDDLARRLSWDLLNGTPAEIRNLMDWFSDPSEIPVDAAANISLAAALVDSVSLNEWLGRLGPEQRGQVYDQLDRSRMGFDQRVQLWEMRATNMLKATCIRQDLSKHPSFFKMLLFECVSAQSIPVLNEIVKELEAQPGGPEVAPTRSAALRRLYNIMAKVEGPQSLVAVLKNPSSNQDAEQLRAAIDLLVRQNRTEAEKLAQEFSGGEVASALREKLIATPDFSKSLSEQFQTVSSLISQQKSAISPATATAIEQFVDTAVYLDRASAAALIERVPEGPLRESVMKKLTYVWSESDPFGASDWLSTLPPSRSRDIAVSELVKATHDDPETALANAAAIQDLSLRSLSAASIVSRWRSLNPEAIQQLINASPFSLEEKRSLSRLVEGKAQTTELEVP